MKKIIFLYLLFTFFMPRHILAQNCELASLASDLSSSTAEFKTIVNESNGFSAWQILNKEVITLRTNVDELTLVSKNLEAIKSAKGYLIWKAVNRAGNEILESARQFVRNNYGQDFLNQITLNYGKENTGALSVLVKRFGNEGADLLKQGKSLDEIASALVKDRKLYRHIGSEAGYLDNLKATGEIPAGYTTYFSADKFDDPIEAISKMQLNSEWTDAIWVAEFDGAQLVGKVEIPKAKWNEASYLEVLTKSFPKWGEGGATQFITKSEISISKLRNLKTGEVIDFTKIIGRVNGKIVNSVAGDIRKFSEYALTNPSKTGLFIDSWGYKLTDADNLLATYKSQAIQAIREGKFEFVRTTEHGTEYRIITVLNTPKNGTQNFYSGWIIKNGNISEVVLSSPFVKEIK